MTNKYVKPRGEFAATVLSLAIPAGGAWFDLNDFELGCLKYDGAFELLDKEPPKPPKPDAPKIEAGGLVCAVPVKDEPKKDEPKKDEPVKDQPKAEPAKAEPAKAESAKAEAAKTASAKPAAAATAKK